MEELYRASRAEREGLEVLTLEGPGGARAEIAPSLGNNCFAFGVRRPVLEPIGIAELRTFSGGRGIPILFPFPNRIRDGRYSFAGQDFTAEPARHGFVRDKAWTVEELGVGAESAFLRSSLRAADCGDAILGQFPFPFRLEVTYTLRGATLEMATLVVNEGERPMPWGFGIHPYFRKPAGGSLEVPAEWRWELEDFLPTGRRLPVEGPYDLHRAALEGLAVDDVFSGLSPGEVSCRLSDPENGVATVIRFRGDDFPNVVVFTPPAPREAICIEPQTCPTDAFNLAARGVPGAGMRVLAPGASAWLRLSLEEAQFWVAGGAGGSGGGPGGR